MSDLYTKPAKGYGLRARIAWWLLTAGCKHERGVICGHRQYLYDFWLAGANWERAGQADKEARSE